LILQVLHRQAGVVVCSDEFTKTSGQTTFRFNSPYNKEDKRDGSTFLEKNENFPLKFTALDIKLKVELDRNNRLRESREVYKRNYNSWKC